MSLWQLSLACGDYSSAAILCFAGCITIGGGWLVAIGAPVRTTLAFVDRRRLMLWRQQRRAWLYAALLSSTP